MKENTKGESDYVRQTGLGSTWTKDSRQLVAERTERRTFDGTESNLALGIVRKLHKDTLKLTSKFVADIPD